MDDVSDLALELMRQTGIKLLWGTCNLFSHPRYMNGAATNPDAHVVAYAAAAVKKGLEVAKKLGAENYGRWRGTQRSPSFWPQAKCLAEELHEQRIETYAVCALVM